MSESIVVGSLKYSSTHEAVCITGIHVQTHLYAVSVLFQYQRVLTTPLRRQKTVWRGRGSVRVMHNKGALFRTRLLHNEWRALDPRHNGASQACVNYGSAALNGQCRDQIWGISTAVAAWELSAADSGAPPQYLHPRPRPTKEVSRTSPSSNRVSTTHVQYNGNSVVSHLIWNCTTRTVACI